LKLLKIPTARGLIFQKYVFLLKNTLFWLKCLIFVKIDDFGDFDKSLKTPQNRRFWSLLAIFTRPSKMAKIGHFRGFLALFEVLANLSKPPKMAKIVDFGPFLAFFGHFWDKGPSPHHT